MDTKVLVIAKNYTDSVALNGVPIKTPQIDPTTKNWLVFNPSTNSYVDTGILAQGTNGVTPTIGGNGNWFIGGTDTNVLAIGQDGKSAYELAVQNGFVGSLSQWLDSLIGEPGDDGEGIPTGGTTGQVLRKKSNADFDTQWIDPPESGSGGGYEPPSGGIPLGDLAQDVKDSLELADTALQEETDPVYNNDKPNIAFKTDLPERLTDLTNDGQDPFVTQSELESAIDGEAQARQDDIETVNDDISAINEKIPTQASDTNQLADKDFVNSSVANTAAHFVSYDAQGNPFPTNAALVGAATFYYRGTEYTPTEHDYTTVINDETYSGEQWRYGYDGVQWFAQYKVNPTPFTSAQQGAIDSNITQSLTTKLGALPDNETLAGQLNAKAVKVTSPTPGNFAGLDAQGNLTDSGKNVADLATSAQGAKADSALQATDIDANPTQGSNKAVSSGGVFAWFGAAVSTLSTTAKTIVAAINELFTNKQDKIAAGTNGHLLTASGTAGILGASVNPSNLAIDRGLITTGTDLNTLFTPGTYRIMNNSGVLNGPSQISASSYALLTVERAGQYIVQTFQQISTGTTGIVFRRSWDNSLAGNPAPAWAVVMTNNQASMGGSYTNLLNPGTYQGDFLGYLASEIIRQTKGFPSSNANFIVRGACATTYPTHPAAPPMPGTFYMSWEARNNVGSNWIIDAKVQHSSASTLKATYSWTGQFTFDWTQDPIVPISDITWSGNNIGVSVGWYPTNVTNLGSITSLFDFVNSRPGNYEAYLTTNQMNSMTDKPPQWPATGTIIKVYRNVSNAVTPITSNFTYIELISMNQPPQMSCKGYIADTSSAIVWGDSSGGNPLNVSYELNGNNSSYLTTERFTGKYWIDGKPIYRRAFSGNVPAAQANQVVAVGLLVGIVDTLVNVGGMINNGDGSYTCANTTLYGVSSQAVDCSNGIYKAANGNVTLNTIAKLARDGTTNSDYKVWVEYTKAS